MSDPIVVVREPGRVALHLVVRDTLEVGRDCAGLLVDDPQVSRRHLELRPTEGRVIVTDLGSSNGTYVAGERITNPVELTADSPVRIGDTSIELSEFDAPARPERQLDVATERTSIERVAAVVQAERPDVGSSLGGGTRTIVFSDIESSTERAVELGDAQWFGVLREHNEIVRRQVAAHGGVEVKSQGDGFMLAFDSARRAVRCMIAVQLELRRRGAADRTRALRIRVGIHTGEAVEGDDGDLFGRAVIIAARIANSASGCEILVSSLVREIIEPWGDIPFGASRTVDLKGIGGRHVVHEIDWASAPEDPD
jgi:class 3 adenylate cyclase